MFRKNNHSFSVGSIDEKLFTFGYISKRMKRKLISSGSTFEDQIGYSRAVVDGDYVFVSGTTGYDYKTMTISDDIVKQTEQCFQNIQETLIKAGSSLDDVVRVLYIVPNAQEFKSCWPVLKKYFSVARPSATMISSQLMDEKMKIEIQVTASLKK